MGYFVIINNSKKKKQAKKPGWREAEAEYEKWLAKHGIDKTQRKKKHSPETYVPPPRPYVRETVHYPSRDSFLGNATKAKTSQYTGDYFVGIATMHKSNLVPVGKDQDARDYATMRRN